MVRETPVLLTSWGSVSVKHDDNAKCVINCKVLYKCGWLALFSSGPYMINYDSLIRWNVAYRVTNKRPRVTMGREIVKIGIIPDAQSHMVSRIIFNCMA